MLKEKHTLFVAADNVCAKVRDNGCSCSETP